jgi:predicted nucleic acid-binding protein
VILVDTSVWIDFLRGGSTELARLLSEAMVLSHYLVRGELACGHLKNRGETLSLLAMLPQATRERDAEVLGLIDSRKLYGRGLGYVDVCLLASTVLTPDTVLWTRDARLADAAHALGISFSP